MKLNKYYSNKIESYENSFTQNDRYKFSFSNSGYIGGAGTNSPTYDLLSVIFISGYWLIGFYSDTLFISGQLTSSLNRDYLPGKAQSNSKLSFEIEKEMTVSLKIYDITGNEILEIFSRYLQPSKYTCKVDFSNFTSGVYFYMFTSSGNREIKKLTFIK